MAVFVKRGRGRPRRDEPPQINNFDLNLIALYKRNPALYDRYDDDYGNRDLADRLWRDMSEELGHDVAMLRDRVQQLRNRFNVEKRKLDALRAENHDDNIQSSWNLYKEMVFLEDHVRWRRRGNTTYSSDSEDAAASQNGTVASIPRVSNGGEVATYQRNRAVQQNESSSPQPQTEAASTPNNSYYVINHSLRNGHVSSTIGTRNVQRINNSNNNSNHANNNSLTNASINNNNNATNATNTDNTENTGNITNNPNRRTNNSSQMMNGLNTNHPLDKTHDQSTYKFKYFSQFMNSCLCDMDEKEAMNLVARFTADICNALKEDGFKRERAKSEDENEAA